MSTDRPLDALIPGLVARATARGLGFFDATVGADRVWVIAIGDDPGGVEAVHHQVANILEAALVRAMAQPASASSEQATETERTPAAVHLFQLVPLAKDLGPALSSFGFSPSSLSGPRWEEIKREISPGPTAAGLPRAWSVPVSRGPRPSELAELDRRLRAETQELWGERPGLPTERLLRHASALFGRPLAPCLSALDEIEDLIHAQQPGVLRWIPPLLLQAVADLIGVIAHHELQSDPAWSIAEPEEDGFVPPPILRIGEGDEEIHVPILLHLIRWWVMPLRAGEEVPRMSAWVQDQFSSAG